MKNILHRCRGGLSSRRPPMSGGRRWLAVCALGLIVAPGWGQRPRLPADIPEGTRESERTPVVLLDAVAYNEDVPPLVSDTDLLKALKLHASQWVQQVLIWPSRLERRIHAGISSYDQRAEMIAWLDAAFQFRPVPPELILNAVEMRNWLVLYSDWAREMGADAFAVRFTNKGFAIHINEAETAIVLAARPERAIDMSRFTPVEYAMSVAQDLMRDYLLPIGIEGVITQEVTYLPNAIEGTWQPSGQGRPRRPLADELPPLAIRFFVVDDFVAFNINKMVWRHEGDPGLYSQRFDPPRDQEEELAILSQIQEEAVANPRFSDPAERIIFYQRLQRELNIKTVEEFLGPMLYDSMGERLTTKRIDYNRLIGVVDGLNQDQRNLLMRQRRVDSYYVEGLKAFERDDLELSIDQWSRALAVDPSNVRISVMLQMALDRKVERDYGGMTSEAQRDQVIDNIRELLAYHRQTVMRSAVAELETERREREIYEMRAKGVELYQQGLYDESVAVWNRILRLDPGNATASLWLATLENRLTSRGNRVAQFPESRGRLEAPQATTPAPADATPAP